MLGGYLASLEAHRRRAILDQSPSDPAEGRKTVLLWPCCQSTGRGREECLFIFPWEAYILCIARRTDFCCPRPSVMYSVRRWLCCAQLIEEQKSEVSTRTTRYAVGQPTGVCVFPSLLLSPRDAGKYCWRRKMGSRYLFFWLAFLFSSHFLSIPSW